MLAPFRDIAVVYGRWVIVVAINHIVGAIEFAFKVEAVIVGAGILVIALRRRASCRCALLSANPFMDTPIFLTFCELGAVAIIECATIAILARERHEPAGVYLALQGFRVANPYRTTLPWSAWNNTTFRCRHANTLQAGRLRIYACYLTILVCRANHAVLLRDVLALPSRCITVIYRAGVVIVAINQVIVHNPLRIAIVYCAFVHVIAVLAWFSKAHLACIWALELV
jgi:hypothetical protein